MKLISAMFLAVLTSTAAAQPGARPAPAPAPPATVPAAPSGPAASPIPSGPPGATAPGGSPVGGSTPAAPGGPDPAVPTTTAGGEILTLERALEIAMKQQPNLRISRAQVEAAAGHVDQARVALLPTLSVDATASIGSQRQISGTAGAGGLGAQPPSGGFFTHQQSTGLGASASWLITDFGRTSAVIRAAELSADATAAALNTSTLDVRTGVETTYLEAVARRRLVQVAEATVKSEDGHLDQARRFVAAGAKDPIEVAQAQSRDANAKSALAQAQSTEAIALANLRSAIGWVEPAHAPVVSANFPAPSEADPPALAELVETARKQRPEIVQLDKELQASDASLTAAHAERRPTLTAQAETQWGPGSGNWSPEPSWSAGLTLGWQLFDGGRASADVRIAQANLSVAAAQRDALLVSLTSQLDSARSQIVADRANVQASTEAVTAARAQLKLAEARYAQGLGSQIELADAQTAVTTAEGNLVTADFQLATAWAQLRRQTAQEAAR
jgi:outer membrane protein